MQGSDGVQGGDGVQVRDAVRARAEHLVTVLQEDNRVEGVAFAHNPFGVGVHGSFRLDVTVVTADGRRTAVASDRAHLFNEPKELPWWFETVGDTSHDLIGVYSDLVELAVHYVGTADLCPDPSAGDWHVVKDLTGWLTLIVEESARQYAAPSALPDRVNDRFWIGLYQTVTRVRSGDLWDAWAHLGQVRGLLTQLLVTQSRTARCQPNEWPRLLDRTDERWLATTVCTLDARSILQAASSSVGLYTSVRARSGGLTADTKLEARVMRLLQDSSLRTAMSGNP